ncbi:MAG TPA: Mth938-like domain-containing protein [Steroidobacteraceae bacterium]|nr:Mth938-like domain-containing protein [Steroidobacteraceae bacterium]
MKFTLDARRDVNLVRGYGAGAVRIGERVVHASCIVAAQTLITEWEAPRIEALGAEHLGAVLALDPEIVILGTGAKQRFPSAALRETLAARGIGVEAMDLGAACRTYNILVQEERRVVALLYVE